MKEEKEVSKEGKKTKKINKGNYADNKKIKELETSLEDYKSKFEEATEHIKSLQDDVMRSKAELIN